MENLIKKSAEAVKNMFENLYNPAELDRLIIDSLDLLIYRFIREDIVIKRHSTMTGTDIAEYVEILKEAEKVTKNIEGVVSILEGSNIVTKEGYEIYDPFKNLFQYLFTNYTLEKESFKKGVESLMQTSFKELTQELEDMIFNYLKVFYYVVSKRYYYIGGTTQVILDGIQKNNRAKELFKKIVAPEELINSINKIIKRNNYKVLNNLVIHLFKSFYSVEKHQLEVIFPIKEVEFNSTDVQLLLGENYLVKTLDENMNVLSKEIKKLVNNKNELFLNSVKNEKIIEFTKNIELFTNNLNIFMNYFCDNLEVFTKTVLISFKDIFEGINKDPMIIPDYVNIVKNTVLAEAKKESLKSKNISKEILTIIVDNIRNRFNKSNTDNILMSTMKIIFSVMPYYKLIDILAEIGLSSNILERYFKNISSLVPALNKVYDKINRAQVEYSKSSRFNRGYLTQFDEEEEFTDLEEEDFVSLNNKKSRLVIPEKISSFESQLMGKVIKNKINSLVKRLMFISVLIQHPRKTKEIEFSKELFEEWYTPILNEKGFKLITPKKIKNLIKSTNMMFNYSKILGKTSILTILGRRDYLYFNKYREYMIKKADAPSIKNATSEDLFKELSSYLAGAGRMLKDFIEIGKIHSKEVIKNIENINNVSLNSVGWEADVKRLSENLNKALEILIKNINDMSGQGIINTILVNAEKEFDFLEKNYIIVVNDEFFHTLIDKI